jgi:hypothetical protein
LLLWYLRFTVFDCSFGILDLPFLIAPLVSSYLSLKSTDLVVNVKEVNHITTEQRDDSPHINIYQEQLILDQNSNI